MRQVLLNLSGRRRLPLIRQQQAAECGIACLAMIATYHGLVIDMASMRRRFSTSLRGMTLKSLVEIAAKLDFISRPVEAPLTCIKGLRLPAIVHWDMNHFTVLKSVAADRFVIHDPARGERIYTRAEFSRHFTGIALELTPAAAFHRRTEKTSIALGDLWGRVHGLWANLTQVLLLSLLLQIFVLVSPFYLQIALDEVLPRNDSELMLVLSLGFAGLTLIVVATQLLRGHVILYLGSMLSYQIASNLFSHLLNLPLAFFEKRHRGDIVSRFSSVQPVQKVISESLVAALIDGIMAITTLVMMFVYSPLLAAIALAAWLLYFIVRMVLYRPYLRAQEDLILSDALEQTTFLETLQGIGSLKLFACETEREQIWQSRYADVINNNARLGKFAIYFESANRCLFGLEHIVLIYLAVKLIMGGEFSIGMLFAFLAYRQNFSDKASALVENLVELRLLGLHLERIADIAHSAKEDKGRDAADYPGRASLSGAMQLRDLRYRYDSGTQEIIRGLDLEIHSGESIAITGASGSGKTTLLKLMTGLSLPDSGEVLVDGESLLAYGLARYRRQIGVVMQVDELFAGSIIENIAFFDADIDLERAKRAAQAALIDAEIMAMPMAYETLVGDMGSTLSGGQKQRLILARAVYRQPKILFMDEGTAHLDLAAEKTINDALGNLGMTRVIIAHRPQTIAAVDRIYRLVDGVLLDGGGPV